MTTPTWQTRPVPPPSGAQQAPAPALQSYWGAPGTSNNQIPGPRPPYGPPTGQPSGSQSSSYVQSTSSLSYRGPAQMTVSGVPNQPPPPLPPGSSPAMLLSGPYAAIPMQPLPAYAPPMSSFQGNRWQPPAPGATPPPPSAPGVVRHSTDSSHVNQRSSMPSTGPGTIASGTSQPGVPAAPSTLSQPPHYQAYPIGPVPAPQSMGPWMPLPQQAVQMQQRPPFSTFQPNYPVPYGHHHPVGQLQDMSAGKGPPQVSGPYGPGGDPSLPPGIGNQGAKMWGNTTPYNGNTSIPTKDVPLAPNGRPAGLDSNSDQRLISTGGDQISTESSERNMKAETAPDAWTAHKTADGAVYYFNSVSGKSTYDKPPGFTGEAEKVTAHPTPASWERLNGTDWALVTTNDGKKYYYNTKTQATSWQVPLEVAELRKKQAEEAPSKFNTEVVAAPGTATEKSTVSFSLNFSAAATGGREAIGHKGIITNSALDLIKKKLQDPGAPTASSPLPPGTSPTPIIYPSGVDGTSGKSENVKDKSKGSNVDAVSSDSSSDSDEEEPGPTKEERIIHFKEMLKEKGIAPFSKWEKELPKIIFDVRFKAIPSHTERRAIFEHYVRTRADEERKEKRAAQKAAVEGFKQLLEEAAKDLSYHTTYENFARTWGQDPRFEALERKDRETLLNERVLPLRRAEDERVRAEHAGAVGAFKEMLLERTEINTSSRWSKIREVVRNDARYSAVKRDEREVLFNAYISELLSAEQEAERAAKAKKEEEAKVKERERELRKRKEREELEMDRVRAKARRKDAVTSYQALLTEKIKDPEASWTEARPKLEKDPLGRATNPELDISDRERLFREHVNEIFDRFVREYRLLLADVITIEAAQKLAEDEKHILTSWSDAKKLLKPDPRYGKMPRRDRESWWRRYAEDVQRRMKAAASMANKDDKTVSGNGAQAVLASESNLRPPGLRRNTSRR